MLAKIEEAHHDAENDGQHNEAHVLDGLAADPVNNQEGSPVARNEAGGQNQSAYTGFMKFIYDARLRRWSLAIG
jgi:hypothetical protein